MPSSSQAPNQPRPVSNQSPVTIYSAPPRVFHPDRLATIDLMIVVVYICLLLSTSISTMIRTKKSMKRKAALAASLHQSGPSTNSLLAGSRKMNWFTVGASIFASNLGSEHFIGLSGSAAANGISVAAFEMNALIILQLATWIFLPVLIVSKISTLPEYMSKRFGGKRIRTYLAILSILLYIFTKISVNLYSGGIFLQQAIGWNLYSSAMFILALTCIMTLTGGLKGAMVIDNLQAFVMTIGASIVSMRALVAIGGWEGLRHKYPNAIPSIVPANLTHCARPNPRAFQMLRPWQDRDMPWLGFIIGQTPASIWYWAADQMMVQRFLTARSLAHVQGAGVFAGYLKVLPMLFMVIPGMISRCLYTDEVGCIDPDECQKYCQSSVSCSNTAYPRLVLELMPMGARGMMVAAMVAALMGDLSNVFNSASALFSCDIWPLFRSQPTAKEQVRVGRIFIICLVLASIMWIPVIQEMQGGQLFIYIQAVAAMFAPPIAGVYICAVLCKRTNEPAAFWSLMLGFALGLLRLTMSFMYKEPSCGQNEDERPWMLKHVHYMYYAAFLFWVTIASCLSISYLTKPPAAFRLIRTTYWTRFETKTRKDDRNVFELKYTSTNRGGGRNPAPLCPGAGGGESTGTSTPTQLTRQQPLDTDDTTSGDTMLMSSRSSQQRLFTIEEQQEKKAADLATVIVDIDGPPAARRPPIQHQASLSASAAEAGKRIASTVNLRGAKDIVMAAASHLKGGGSGVRFKNLNEREGDDFDDDDDDDDVANKQSTRLTSRDKKPSEQDDTGDVDTTVDEEEEFARRRRQKRNKRSQSVLSAALSSYKSKQMLGYKKAQADDFEDDEEEEDDDDDDNETANLNRHPSFKRRGQQTSKRSAGGETGALNKAGPPGFSGVQAAPIDKLGTGKHQGGNRKSSLPPISSRGMAASQVSLTTGSDNNINDEDEDDDDQDIAPEPGKTYKCLDSSVSMLIKSPLEEAILLVAVVAIILVAIGLFVLFSLPPSGPPKQVVDILIKN